MDGKLSVLLLLSTGFGAGIVNALAGGGPILTLGVLSLTGIDPRIANLTSTVALSPGQLLAGWMMRHRLHDVRLGSPSLLVLLAIIGGAAGATLLLATSGSAFKALVPWLVLLATGIYATSGLVSIVPQHAVQGRHCLYTGLFAPLAAYGGYFGGGNSFLVLALLSISGHSAKASGEIKNVLIAAINLGAVIVFISSGRVDWPTCLLLCAGGIVGSYAGARLLGHLPTKWVRAVVIVFGLLLAGWMFLA